MSTAVFIDVGWLVVVGSMCCNYTGSNVRIKGQVRGGLR